MPETVAKYLGTRDVARMFGRSTETIRMWCREGILPHRKMRGRIYFLPDEIDAVMQAMPGLALAPPPDVDRGQS